MGFLSPAPIPKNFARPRRRRRSVWKNILIFIRLWRAQRWRPGAKRVDTGCKACVFSTLTGENHSPRPPEAKKQTKKIKYKGESMGIAGKVHKVGEHIDTDAIIPARFLVTTDPVRLGENCMEGLEHDWIKRVSKGDILVAERNFGCGSSREHAPISIIGAGISMVIAHSFARIFYRNAFNMGLLLLEIGDEVDKIGDGDKLDVDAEAGLITNLTTGAVIRVPALSPFMRSLLDKGGLIPYVRERLARTGS